MSSKKLTIILGLLVCIGQATGELKPVIHRPAIRTTAPTTTALKICALRVSFVPDDNPATTGNGQFLTTNTSSCTEFCLDPPPHDRAYFYDHLRALHNYYAHVSHGQVTIDTLNSQVFPLTDEATYQVPHPMAYYHPFLHKDSVDLRLTELFYDAIQAADAEVDFAQFDLVIVFHAGVGQDFDIYLDPTPYDIPSGYITPQDLKNLLAPDDLNFAGIAVDNGTRYIDRGLILPETQNHLLYDNWSEVFGNVETPCELQIGLNGTLALVFGFYLGLPALYDTETGTTGIGKFGLMDQGSANLNGLAPAVPCAWERTFLGWETPVESASTALIQLAEVEAGTQPTIYKVPLNATEYFLIENRNAHVRPGVSLDSIRYAIYAANGYKHYPSLFPLLRDSLHARFSPTTGVMLSIPKYDYGLPGSGLLIWHIDEAVIQANLATNRVNLNKERRGVDLEEGDGAQDIGFETSTLYTDINIGWFFDPWFAGNEGFFHLNPDYPVDPEKRVGFTPQTNPATMTNDYLYTGISIDSIGPAGRLMEFRIVNSATPPNFPLHLPAPVTFFSPIGRQGHSQADALVVASDSTYLFDAAGKRRAAVARQDQYAIGHSSFTGFVSLADSLLQLTTWQVTSSYDLIQLSQIQVTDKSLAQQSLVVGERILFTTRTKQTQQYQLGLYDPSNAQFQWFNLDAPLAALLGDSANCFAIRADDYLCQINCTPLNCIPLRNIPNLTAGAKVLAYIDENQLIDLIHYYNGTLTIYFDIVAAGGTIARQLTLDDEIICGDIDQDGRVEIIAHDAQNIYAFNQDLKIEYNLPFELPTILAGDRYIGNLRCGDLDGDQSADLLIATTRGLVAFDATGHLLTNYPLNFQPPLADSGTLLNNSTGVGFYALTASTQISAVNLGGGRIHSSAWLCPGGNTTHSYLYPLIPGGSGSTAGQLLNSKLTFNWPNPARQQRTYIRYYVNASCNVNIKIYDLAGDLIASFDDHSPTVGDFNEKEWYVGNVANGVYFAVVEAKAGNRSESKVIKIMVIR